MKNYYSIYNKKTLIKSLPKIVSAHKEDHQIFFITFTFLNVHREISKEAYTNYLKAFYQKLNQLCMNRPSKYPHRKAKMILVPELSHKCQAKSMEKSHHFHGFLMVHKSNLEKFYKKCVAKNYFYKKGNQIKNKFSLNNGLVNQAREPIKTFTVDMELVISQNSIERICRYITKTFEAPEDREFNFSLEQVREFQKAVAAIQDKSVYDNPYFSYEDIQWFCDISKNGSEANV